MIRPMRRETATDKADLPHEYCTSSTQACDVCGTASNDPRHVAWERQRLADRETANAQFARELGS